MGAVFSRPREVDESSVHGKNVSMEDLTFDEPEVTSRLAPSIVYDEDGEFDAIPDTYKDMPIFRKMKPEENEKRVARILQAHPHPNLVDIYHVCDDYIDMELLMIPGEGYNTLDIERAHEHLLKHNIVYMDWKPGNYGKDLHGITKVFDFDSSGMMDRASNTWVYCPPNYYAMGKASEAGHINPLDVDRYSFEERDTIWQ